jgi:hypothetical protein
MSAFYVYKMVVDDGGAPCVTSRPRLLSLALCKPEIRRTAREGDFVFGFAGNELKLDYPGNPLIYIAKITRDICGERYYSSAEFAARPDCIYTYNGRVFLSRKGAKYHNDDENQVQDLGREPSFRNARVLISEESRYFGTGGPKVSAEYPALRKLLQSLMRGHRVNHSEALHIELLRFREEVWKKRGLPATRVSLKKDSLRCGGNVERHVRCSS